MFLVMYYEKCKQEFRIIGEMLDKTEKEKKINLHLSIIHD